MTLIYGISLMNAIFSKTKFLPNLKANFLFLLKPSNLRINPTKFFFTPKPPNENVYSRLSKLGFGGTGLKSESVGHCRSGPLIASVADPGCLSRIPDPDFYPSRIPDLGSKNSNKREWLSYHFLWPQISQKLKLFYFRK
jgi:hypothetical protein